MNSKMLWVTGIGVILTSLTFFVPYTAAQQPQAQQASPAVAPAQNQNQTQNQKQAQTADVVSETKKDGEETVFDNGVKMKILRAGKGPKPAPNAIVQIQYIGSLGDGTEFDRSYSRRYPSIYKLSDVIGCWQTGIPEMQVGSKVKLTCPPGSANGKRPVDFIWGDTTLYFVIELIAITG